MRIRNTRSSFFWIVIIVIINYLVGKSEPQLLPRHAHYILAVYGTVDKIFQLLYLDRDAVSILFKRCLVSHKLLIFQHTGCKNSQRSHH